MGLQGLIAAHMPLAALGVQDEPSELTRNLIDEALAKTTARISEMSGEPFDSRTTFVGVVRDADAAGLTMEAFGQMFDEALRETL